MNRICSALHQHHRSIIAPRIAAAVCREGECDGSRWRWLCSKSGGGVAAVNKDADKAPKKAKESPKITLIGLNQSVSVTALDEAKKLAKRRDLHLMRMQDFDAKTQRAVYKLVTNAEMLAEELKELQLNEKMQAPAPDKSNSDQQRKSEKSLTIGSRISEHDLSSRLKNITKWLAKRHEVRILIQGHADDTVNCERITKSIEQSIKEPTLVGKIVQKRTKGSIVKFSIVPVVAAAPATA